MATMGIDPPAGHVKVAPSGKHAVATDEPIGAKKPCATVAQSSAELWPGATPTVPPGHGRRTPAKQKKPGSHSAHAPSPVALAYVPGPHGGGASGGGNGGGSGEGGGGDGGAAGGGGGAGGGDGGGSGGGDGEAKLAVPAVAVGAASKTSPAPPFISLNHWLSRVATEVCVSVVWTRLAASVLLMTRSASTVRLPAVTFKMTSTTLGILLLSTAMKACPSKLATSPAIANRVRTIGT